LSALAKEVETCSWRETWRKGPDRRQVMAPGRVDNEEEAIIVAPNVCSYGLGQSLIFLSTYAV